MTNDSWQRVDHCVSAPVENGVVILDLDKGLYYSFSDTAAVIWNLLTEARRRDDIEAALRAEFDVSPERCASAVDGFLADLAGKDLIRLAA